MLFSVKNLLIFCMKRSIYQITTKDCRFSLAVNSSLPPQMTNSHWIPVQMRITSVACGYAVWLTAVQQQHTTSSFHEWRQNIVSTCRKIKEYRHIFDRISKCVFSRSLFWLWARTFVLVLIVVLIVWQLFSLCHNLILCPIHTLILWLFG